MTRRRATLRIATRKSRLAMWQAEHVARLLREAHAHVNVALVPMTTQGDRIVDRSLAEAGGKGLFIKELELAIEEDRADIAVHSMKDVPSELPAGMTLSAMLTRADPSDAFVSTRFSSFESLPQGARIGTSSPRRQSQLKHARPDLQITTLRGNVETRLRKLDEGEYDAIVLACAGLMRLELSARITQRLDASVCLPAVGQGVIGIECRAEDALSLELTQVLRDSIASRCCTAERAFARRLQGSCFSPIAAFADVEGSRLRLQGAIGSLDGRHLRRDSIEGDSQAAESLGVELAERMLDAGAGLLLAMTAEASNSQ